MCNRQRPREPGAIESLILMPTFITQLIEGEPAVVGGSWENIQKAAAKHQRSMITVEEYSPDAPITNQQIKFWWTKPVALLQEPGYSKHEAEEILKKSTFLREFFVHKVRGHTVILSIRDMTIKEGIDIFECCYTGMPKEFGIPCPLPDKRWREHQKENK